MQNNDKTNKSFRQLFKERGYYIVLLLCVAAVGVSGYFFVRTVQTAPDSTDPTVTLSQQPDTTQTPQTQTPDADTAEALNPTDETPDSSTNADEKIQETASALTVWPINGEILQNFSVDALVFNETMQDWRVHEGIDIAATQGATVSAARAGTVSAVYDDDFLGTVVVVDVDEDTQMVYANLTEMPTVSAGDAVTAGQTIGAVGNTALLEVSSVPHLHFEVRQNGVAVDPAEFLPAQ